MNRTSNNNKLFFFFFFFFFIVELLPPWKAAAKVRLRAAEMSAGPVAGVLCGGADAEEAAGLARARALWVLGFSGGPRRRTMRASLMLVGVPLSQAAEPGGRAVRVLRRLTSVTSASVFFREVRAAAPAPPVPSCARSCSSSGFPRSLGCSSASARSRPSRAGSPPTRRRRRWATPMMCAYLVEFLRQGGRRPHPRHRDDRRAAVPRTAASRTRPAFGMLSSAPA